jgi:hypothetical protein
MSKVLSVLHILGIVYGILMAVILVLALILTVLAVVDEYLTRKKRRAYLERNRPELLAAEANDNAFFEIVERFRDGI